MPARKPQGLHTRHSTKAEKDARIAAESSMEPERGLPALPARLKDHPVAAAVWREIMRLYGELEATIVTRLDMHVLLDYCILIEQLGELDQMRAIAYKVYLQLADEHRKSTGEVKGIADPELRRAGEKELAALAIEIVGAFDAVVKLDARADQKRKTLFQMRQSLYMTPRSRAAAAPTRKPKEEEPDPMEQLLDEANHILTNGVGNE